MAAIDFPDNPTIGDVFQSNGKAWIWDGTVWEIRQYLDSFISDSIPSNPQEGNTWFNSSTGQFFIYYDSHWVEVGLGPKGDPGEDATPTIISDTQPTSPVEGTRWLKSTTWQEFVYYNNEWIELI